MRKKMIISICACTALILFLCSCQSESLTTTTTVEPTTIRATTQAATVYDEEETISAELKETTKAAVTEETTTVPATEGTNTTTTSTAEDIYVEEYAEEYAEEYIEEYVEEYIEEYSESDYTDAVSYSAIYSDEEIYNMAKVVYLENGMGCPACGTYYSVYLTACCILNRANNLYGGSITAALYDPGQYDSVYREYDYSGNPIVINDITWQAVYEALANCDPNPYFQGNGHCLDGVGGAEYYRDPISDEAFYYLY